MEISPPPLGRMARGDAEGPGMALLRSGPGATTDSPGLPAAHPTSVPSRERWETRSSGPIPMLSPAPGFRRRYPHELGPTPR